MQGYVFKKILKHFIGFIGLVEILKKTVKYLGRLASRTGKFWLVLGKFRTHGGKFFLFQSV